jgi:hypothetical protein
MTKKRAGALDAPALGDSPTNPSSDEPTSPTCLVGCACEHHLTSTSETSTERGTPMPTAVIYRAYPDDGDVVALFPEAPSSVTDPHLVTCYQHIGQHGAADYQLVVKQTRLATEAEAESLHQELQSIGYDDLRR